MADSRFYKRLGPFTLEELCKLIGSEVPSILPTNYDPLKKYTDVVKIELATQEHIAVIHVARHKELLSNTKAGICIIPKGLMKSIPQNTICIPTDTPFRDYATILSAFYPKQTLPQYQDPTARIHPTAKIGQNVHIAPYVIIGRDVIIKDNTEIHPHSIIEQGVQIGQYCSIGAHCHLSHCLISDKVTLATGVKLGQSTLESYSDKTGTFSLPQVGRVFVGQNVDVGANTVIDRGSIGDTVIGDFTSIYSNVSIGHGVAIGRRCTLVSQVGIAGNTVIGDNVFIGGQAGVADHLKIGSNVFIAGKSGIAKNIESGQKVGGIPAIPIKQWHRQTLMMKKLLES